MTSNEFDEPGKGGDSIPDAVDDTGKVWLKKKDESFKQLEQRTGKELDPIQQLKDDNSAAK